MLLNPRRTRTNMKLLQLVWIFLLTLCGQSGIIAVTVKEDGEVILDCSFVGENIEKKAFSWKKDVDQSNEEVFWFSDGDTDPGPQFKGRVFHFPDQLRFGNASIKITKTKTSDSGTYTCYHASIQKDIKSTISLTVGASPKPFITILEETLTSALLQCVVQGSSPKPEVVWKDSDGNSLRPDDEVVRNTTGNKFDTVLHITVTKTDNYTCVATQKKIYHQINSTIFVRLNGGTSKPSVTILEAEKGTVHLRCEVFGASPDLQVFWKNKAGQDVSTEEPKKIETGGGYDIILQTTVTKTDYYRCVTTEGKKDDEVYSETHVVVPESSIVVPVVVTAVVAVLITAVIVGVLAFVFGRRSKSNTGGPTSGII